MNIYIYDLRKVASKGINHHVEHCIFVPASRVLFSSRCPTFRVSLLSSPAPLILRAPKTLGNQRARTENSNENSDGSSWASGNSSVTVVPRPRGTTAQRHGARQRIEPFAFGTGRPSGAFASRGVGGARTADVERTVQPSGGIDVI